jgi:SAM-dependent methyltransferase
MRAEKSNNFPKAFEGALIRISERRRLEGVTSGQPRIIKDGGDLTYDVRDYESLLRMGAALRACHPDETKRPKVLVLASGYGQLGNILEEENMEPILIEMSRKNVLYGKEQGTAGGVQADAGLLPIKDNSVDFGISDHFLCSAYPAVPQEKEEEIINEVLRVLKKDGILILHDLSGVLVGDYRADYPPYITSNFKTVYLDSFSFGMGLKAVLQKRNWYEMMPLRRLYDDIIARIADWRDRRYMKRVLNDQGKESDRPCD